MSDVPVIGIDLGTTYSCVAVLINEKVEVIANDHGKRITPSYVAFNEYERLIGDAALQQSADNAENTIFDAKRLIGRKYHEKVVQKDIQYWPFIVLNSKGKPKIRVEVKGETKEFYPEEISSMVLSKMKETVEDYLGTTVTKAVITVPAYFNDQQRQATKDAGKIAGLEVLRIINEPIAAALAYGFEKRKSEEKQNVLIFDLGGGTFDVSILSIYDGIFKVRSTAGDTHLGGEDFDNTLADFCCNEFENSSGRELDARARLRLKRECEKAKISLSTSAQAKIIVESLSPGVDFRTMITRAKFEAMNAEFFDKTIDLVRNAISDAKISVESIDEVILVGGSTRIPKIREMLQQFFKGKILNKSINPDEAVAIGAAVQGAILAGDQTKEVQSIYLMDVAPLSLGVEVGEHMVMDVIIPRNTSIPVKKSREYTTVHDNQEAILIRVYEGEREFVADNNFLGEFKLDGIKPAKKKVPKFDVTFEINTNGILNVSAIDKATKKSEKITIDHRNGRLNKEEIERMIRQSEKNKAEDRKTRKAIDVKNHLEKKVLDTLSYLKTEKCKNEIPVVERLMIEMKCNDINKWLQEIPSKAPEEYLFRLKEFEDFYRSHSAGNENRQQKLKALEEVD